MSQCAVCEAGRQTQHRLHTGYNGRRNWELWLVLTGTCLPLQKLSEGNSHNQGSTTFRHPVTGEISAENEEFNLQEHRTQPKQRMCDLQGEPRPGSMVSESSTSVASSPAHTPTGVKSSRSSFGKREQTIRRNPNIPVVVRGWLYKQDSSGMRLWKRKWFVVSGHCLFYYKDSREEAVLGTVSLPSYTITPVQPGDHISRKYAFKACHIGKNHPVQQASRRTYYFSADTQEDMNGWIRAMNQAALVQRVSEKAEQQRESPEQQVVPQANHLSIGTSHSENRTPVAPLGELDGLSDVARVEPNGGQRDTDKHVQRKSTLAQVENWVKVQKGDPRSLYLPEVSVVRRTPPMQPKLYQSLPRVSHLSAQAPPPQTLPSDYKYAQDRVSHLRMSLDEREAWRAGAVWQLYEWQQRQRFKQGSPAHGSSHSPSHLHIEPAPFSVSGPASPSDVSSLSPRRPHTPAERVTVRPVDERPVSSMSPRRPHYQHARTTPMDRRSVPPLGYMTHTVSAPSLHGKTADDTFMQLKSNLDYLDLKVTGGESLKIKSSSPVKIAESDVDVKLSRLCEQDKILQELEERIRSLKADKDKLECVLDVSHQQMEQYRGQATHADKIAFQQKLLQEDMVQIRAEISRLSTEMQKAWQEYGRLELDVELLRGTLQEQMKRSNLSQLAKSQMKKELWRIEDVLAGLSSSKANYKVTVESVKNPERKLVPSIPCSVLSHLVPGVGDVRPSSLSPPLSPVQRDDDAPPRPPLPQIYSPDDHPPVIPPLPKEAIRHTSVRGLKRQSDERKRDRESGQYTNGDYRVELRSYVSEPELSATVSGYQTLPSKGLTGSTSRLNQSANVCSYATLRRGVSAGGLQDRPRSAVERLYSVEPRGRMSADEQLERMKRHQKLLVRERKRALGQVERSEAPPSPASGHAPSILYMQPVSADLGSWKREQEFDLQLLERAVPVETQDAHTSQSDQWLTVQARPVTELDLEPVDFSVDISRELSKPQKVSIPERYVELEEQLSERDAEARYHRAQRIRTVLIKSSVQNLQPPADGEQSDVSETDTVNQQEKMMCVSYALASAASSKSKEVAAKAASEL